MDSQFFDIKQDYRRDTIIENILKKEIVTNKLFYKVSLKSHKYPLHYLRQRFL